MEGPKRVVVVAGGEFLAVDAQRIVPDKDLIIAADGGAAKIMTYGMIPDLLVGDMDTLQKDKLEWLQTKDVKILQLPVEKDVTDTHFACEQAIALQPEEVALFGLWGGARMDHSLANVSLLEWLIDQGMEATIYAGTNRVRMLKGPSEITLQNEHFQYLSLLPVSRKIEGIDTHGLKYTLKNGSLTRGYTRGISNELVADQATIRIGSGKVLLIESSD